MIMKVEIFIAWYILMTVWDGTAGHWCHKCRGTNNDACLSRATQCSNGEYCANTFERSADNPSQLTMVRKRCAAKCPAPGVLECNKRNTKCSLCCQGGGCNRELITKADSNSTVDTPREPCYLPVCLDEEINKPRVKVPPHAEQVHALLRSHHEHLKSRVAFSVHSNAVTEGYGPHHVVRFPNIFTNFGGLFDGMSNLAELTIDKPGLYHLSVHVVATDGGDSALLTLKRNGIAILHSKPFTENSHNYILPTGYIQTVLNLENGDKIQLSVEKVTKDSKTSPSDVIFNGYLIV